MTGCLIVPRDDPEYARTGLGAYARRYQALGFAVLGLGVLSKRPHKLTRGGVHWADTSPAAVEWMWGQVPMAGIGIACGSASGLLVVDLDRHGSADGLASWQSFLAVNNLYAPPGPWVQTPGGGEHHYYRLPPGLVLHKRPGLLPGVDVQAEHSYVAAPPSHVEVSYDDPHRPGSVRLPYTWHGCPCEIPPAPDWMISWVATAPSTGGSGSNGEADGDDLPELAELTEHGLPTGLRNVTLMRLACQQYRRYGSDDRQGQARETISRVLDATDRAGFSGDEIERTIASARQFVARAEAEELAAWHSVYGRR